MPLLFRVDVGATGVIGVCGCVCGCVATIINDDGVTDVGIYMVVGAVGVAAVVVVVVACCICSGIGYICCILIPGWCYGCMVCC